MILEYWSFAWVLPAYLVGAIPFGYLVARSQGIDIFQTGSGNIGATNVGRVLGRRWGLIVFALDWTKGALPTVLARHLTGIDSLAVAVGLAALFGHLFPIYLRFRGGKGVATGAGVVLVLLPVPTLAALLAWLTVVSTTRYVSLASLIAAVTLAGCRWLTVAEPWSSEQRLLTVFASFAVVLLVVRHTSNIRRLIHGSENRLPDTPIMVNLSKTLHVTALGFWAGAVVFFNFLAAPAIFAGMREAVERSPGTRTAMIDIRTTLDDDRRGQLANALAGAAVGPVFPRFFAFQFTCGLVAVTTAWSWSRWGRLHRWRAWLISAGFVTVLIGWPLSDFVAALRIARFVDDPDQAATAKSAFATCHLLSLGLSIVTAVLVVAALSLASRLPSQPETGDESGEPTA